MINVLLGLIVVVSGLTVDKTTGFEPLQVHVRYRVPEGVEGRVCLQAVIGGIVANSTCWIQRERDYPDVGTIFELDAGEWFIQATVDGLVQERKQVRVSEVVLKP